MVMWASGRQLDQLTMQVNKRMIESLNPTPHPLRSPTPYPKLIACWHARMMITLAVPLAINERPHVYVSIGALVRSCPKRDTTRTITATQTAESISFLPPSLSNLPDFHFL